MQCIPNVKMDMFLVYQMLTAQVQSDVLVRSAERQQWKHQVRGHDFQSPQDEQLIQQ